MIISRILFPILFIKKQHVSAIIWNCNLEIYGVFKMSFFDVM